MAAVARPVILWLLCVCPLALSSVAWAAESAVSRAEALAAEAVRLSETDRPGSLARAREALKLTEDFDPTAFVRIGRKGEIVEDTYLEAREAYRRHRAGLYAALGTALARSEQHVPAVRLLRRAFDLDATPSRGEALARSLLAAARPREALAVLLSGDLSSFAGSKLAPAEQAADALGLASLQVEIDRIRLSRLEVEPRIEHRDGPFRLPRGARLSSGAPFDPGQGRWTLLYVAEPSCRTCSADLEALKGAARQSLRIVMAPDDADRDHALRQVMRMYRYDWPMLLQTRVSQSLGLPVPSVMIVARGGLGGAVVRPPFRTTLGPALEVLGRSDVSEAPPRPGWDRRPPDRSPVPPRPALLEDGLAPGEDEPAPPAFDAAVEAYRAGRYRESMKLFESLATQGDGWLLSPEARLNRALCLAGLGRRDQARRLLLRTGDSRFQDALDRTLEKVGSAGR